MPTDDPTPAGLAPESRRDPVVQRILAVLEACAAERRPVTITELAEATGLAKTTVHRMCWKLEDLGMLEHSADGFSIGKKMLTLGNANPIINDLRIAAIPYLVELQKLAGASQLAILSEGRALIVDGLYTRELRANTLMGAGLPLHSTAVGKAILARLSRQRREEFLTTRMLRASTPHTIVNHAMIRRHLERVVEQGYAVSNEEFQLGVVAVASAFRVREDTYAAIGCLGSSTDRIEQRSAARVSEAARQLQLVFDQT
ncbi:IclR family transcriptional regulator [Rhodococcus sp. LB1]|uniref:IclR family transcriptional regulator n=1 Tax=Rhodococcus sp. LB1 TaxID=1807499 RepID=UPI000A6029FC|nr:IclR family transcriptional regulator [Rhodococcus sp. LB1]